MHTRSFVFERIKKEVAERAVIITISYNSDNEKRSFLRMEKRRRSIMKTITWRTLATATTVLLVFIFTGNLMISTSVGILELLTKILMYYVHERIWNMLDFGRGG